MNTTTTTTTTTTTPVTTTTSVTPPPSQPLFRKIADHGKEREPKRPKRPRAPEEEKGGVTQVEEGVQGLAFTKDPFNSFGGKGKEEEVKETAPPDDNEQKTEDKESWDYLFGTFSATATPQIRKFESVSVSWGPYKLRTVEMGKGTVAIRFNGPRGVLLQIYDGAQIQLIGKRDKFERSFLTSHPVPTSVKALTKLLDAISNPGAEERKLASRPTASGVQTMLRITPPSPQGHAFTPEVCVPLVLPAIVDYIVTAKCLVIYDYGYTGLIQRHQYFPVRDDLRALAINYRTDRLVDNATGMCKVSFQATTEPRDVKHAFVVVENYEKLRELFTVDTDRNLEMFAPYRGFYYSGKYDERFNRFNSQCLHLGGSYQIQTEPSVEYDMMILVDFKMAPAANVPEYLKGWPNVNEVKEVYLNRRYLVAKKKGFTCKW